MNNHEEIDLTLAIQLQAQFEEELRAARESLHNQDEPSNKGPTKSANNKRNPSSNGKEEKLSVALVDPSWEMIDPNPNIHDLFFTFNQQFFWGTLHAVEVKWSPRMTLCAGVCSYEGRGGLCSVRLSVPLLKLRPRKDLVETLLHEMIHAYLFVADRDRDRDGHGPKFHEHMYRINRIAGTHISVYHSFHDEVNVYRQHVWQCDGPCRQRPPYYGLVKRSMNRPPSARDPWWGRHLQSCGGNYSKIQEPEGYGTKKRKQNNKLESNKKKLGDITKYISTSKKDSTSSDNSSVNKAINGLNTNNSGTVNTINVNRAKNANVHGFSKNDNNNNRNSSSQPNKTVGRGGILTKVNGGSKTIVKGKTKEDKTDENITNTTTNNLNINYFNPFSGTGKSLKSDVSSGKVRAPGVSRLLDLYNQNPSTSNKNKKCVTKVPDTRCPLCNIVIECSKLDDHIAFCLGDLEDDFELNENNTINATPSSDLNVKLEPQSNTKDISASSKINSSVYSNFRSRDDITDVSGSLNSTILINSDNEDEIQENNINKNNSNLITIGSPEGEKYPCPVCSELILEKNINLHLDGHFK